MADPQPDAPTPWRIEDEAVCYVGQAVGECSDCCTAETDGDLCKRCLPVLSALIDFGREVRAAAIQEGRERAARVAVGMLHAKERRCYGGCEEFGAAIRRGE